MDEHHEPILPRMMQHLTQGKTNSKTKPACAQEK